VIERLILISGRNKKIEPEHVPLGITEACHTAASAGGHKQGKKLQDILLSFEKKIIEEYLIRANWNKTAVAKQLGIHRSTLYEKITQFGIRQDPPK